MQQGYGLGQMFVQYVAQNKYYIMFMQLDYGLGQMSVNEQLYNV